MKKTTTTKTTKAKAPAAPKKKAAAAPKTQPAETAKPVFGLHSIKPPKGAVTKRKLLGRGTSSGHGKTSTRGSKGQTSRAGHHTYIGFEGGQSPLIRKMPKRGFTSKFAVEYQVVNIESLNVLTETVTPATLLKSGLIKSGNRPVKILGEGELKKALKVSAHAFSKSAQEKIAQAGGTTEVIKNA